MYDPRLIMDLYRRDRCYQVPGPCANYAGQFHPTCLANCLTRPTFSNYNVNPGYMYSRPLPVLYR